jgi:TonB family protein
MKKASESKSAPASVPASAPAPAPVQPPPAPKPPVPEPVKATASAPASETEPARLISQVPLAFPQRAVQMRWEMDQDHVVRLKVFVGEQGQALKVSITEGVEGTYGFDEAAVESAYKSTYKPAMRDGKAVRGWTPEIVYKFPRRR